VFEKNKTLTIVIKITKHFVQNRGIFCYLSVDTRGNIEVQVDRHLLGHMIKLQTALKGKFR
jgi:hypothetical protein